MRFFQSNINSRRFSQPKHQTRCVQSAKQVEIQEDKLQERRPSVQVTSDQIQEVVQAVVQETQIAELELEVGDFQLSLRRSTGAAAFSQPLVSVQHEVAPLPPAAAAPTTQIALQSIEDSTDELDEGIIYITSPTVGNIKLGKYVKGRLISKEPMFKEGDNIKAGQSLLHIERLGSVVPVETPQAGEIRKFRIEEGDPVEYKQVVVEIAPYFGGHIIGDRKYA